MSKGTILFLNGTSSSGKTSIANELLRLLEREQYMYLSVDHAISGVNEMLIHMYGPQLTRAEVNKIEAEEWIENSVISLFHHTILAFSTMGKNVIVDHVLADLTWLEECVQLFSNTKTYFIRVQCPLEELERRELRRGDRPIGLARAQFDKVHQQCEYDLEVNTYSHTITECAAAIKDFIG